MTPEHLLLPSYCCGRIMPTEGQYKLQSADRLSQAVAPMHQQGFPMADSYFLLQKSWGRLGTARGAVPSLSADDDNPSHQG